MIFIEPVFERAEFFLQFKDLLRVDNRRIDLQPVADDPRIGEQAGAILLGIFRNFFDLESTVGFVEVFGLLQDRDPRKPSLVDFKHEALKEFVVIFKREAVLGIVINLIKSIFSVRIAIIAVRGHAAILLCQSQKWSSKHRIGDVTPRESF